MSREVMRWKVGKNLNYFHLIVLLFFLFFSLIVINQGSSTFDILIDSDESNLF